MKKVFWGITVILAILVGLIPIFYLKDGVSEGYLELKIQEVLKSKTWWVFLYTHIISGGIAILIGWIQFSKTLHQKYTKWHRIIGKLYFISSLIGSISGFYLGFYATGGWLQTDLSQFLAFIFTLPSWAFFLSKRNSSQNIKTI